MSEVEKDDTPSFEGEGQMSTDTLTLASAGKNGRVSRQPLPLIGDASANGRSGGMFKSICQRVRRCDKKNLEPTIQLAVEIAREGREGRRIGTLFTFGDADAVLARSPPLILDPLAGHAEQSRQIRDPNLRGTIKELAQLDGAFVVSDQGIVLSGCRYLDAAASDVAVPTEWLVVTWPEPRSHKLPMQLRLSFRRVRW
jgi:hypothetical protein